MGQANAIKEIRDYMSMWNQHVLIITLHRFQQAIFYKLTVEADLVRPQRKWNN
jgi:hypothetical protein